jgi:hypothetical protein
MMNKRQQILREAGEDLINSDMNDVFDKLDTYHICPPSVEDTNQLIQSLKPVFSQQGLRVTEGKRFRDTMAETPHNKGIPAIIALVGVQMSLMSSGFVIVTIAFLILGLLVTNVIGDGSSKFLITASPFLGLLTLCYEHRAQLYKVEEMEQTCRYSPAQIDTARIVVVLGYNMVLGMVATLLLKSFYTVVIWNLMMNWLAPLLLIVGIALFTSLKFGITGGCIIAGAVWTAQVTLADGASFLHLLLPSLTKGTANIISMLFGIGLLYFSLNIWQGEEKMSHLQ